MFSRAYQSLALLLPLALPTCHHGGATGIPSAILRGCPADLHLAGHVATLADLPFSALLDVVQARNFTTGWEPGENGGGIIRAVRNDALTGKTTTLSFEVAPLPGRNHYPSCADGVTLVSRMEVDGQLMDGYEIEDALLGFVEHANTSGPHAAVTPSRVALPAPQATPPLAPTEPLDGQAQSGSSMAPVTGNVAARRIVVSEDETWCCMTVGDLVRRFSTDGAATAISADRSGTLSLAITDPSGRWKGWRAFTLTLSPDLGDPTMLVRPSAIVVGNKTALTDDPSANDRISTLMRKTFDLHEVKSASVDFGSTYNRCMATGDAAQGIQSALQDCIGAEYGRRDSELNRVYRATMATLPPDRKDALRSEERAWLITREQKCATPTDPGTLQLFEAAYCLAAESVVRTRAISATK